MTTGMAIRGIHASGPPIAQITNTNKKINGRSTTATRVAEVKKSRKLSNSRRVAASTPAEGGRAAISMSRT